MSKAKKFHILALESSADETSAAVLAGDKKSFKLLSNIIASQIKIHQKTGGIVPEVAARAHLPQIIPVIKLALKEAKINLNHINAIAVTSGPGLITSLRIGVDTAKAMAFALSKPIIPINHHEGHLLSALGSSNYQLRTTNYPALGLVVSGGHTMLVLVEKIGRYKILGATLDDAAGEAFDKIAKIMKLPYPGGPQISKLATKGNPQAFDFPRPLINSKDYNFSFSGLKTAVLYFMRDSKFKIRNSDLAASVEQAIIDVLVAKTVRAAKQYKAKTVLLGGGVSANRKLRQTLTKAFPSSDLRLPSSELTTDNAGMIAVAAYYKFINGKTTKFDKVIADPNFTLKNWN